MTKQFFIVTFNDELELKAGTFTGSFSGKSFVGHGKLHFPYRDDLWNKSNTEGTEVIVGGGILNKGAIFRGTIKNALIDQQKYIIVELDDYGKNFTRNYDGRYKNKSLEKVLISLGSECDYTTVLDDISPALLDTLISRTNTIEYGELNLPSETPITGDINGTISGLFKSSCLNCQGVYSQFFYITTVLNYCPNCNKYDSLIVNESSVENKYQCTNCKAQFCGIDGFQTNLAKSSRLKILYGPKKGTLEELGDTPSYSLTPSTYEDEIKVLCQKYGLYPYLNQYNKLIIKQYRGTPIPDKEIDINEVEYKTYKFINSTNQQIKTVVVNYSGGSVTVKEQGYNSIDKIVLDHPELNKKEAEDLANQTMQEQLKKITSEMYVNVLLNYSYSPGTWVKIPNFTHPWKHTGPTMYIDTVNVSMEAGKIHKSTLTLKYTPEIMERKIDIPPTVKPTFDQIIKEALTLQYSMFCRDYECVEAKRTGDALGISDWLYTNFTNIGIRSRIISYDSPYIPKSNHYIIQLFRNGQWYDFNYANYNFDIRLHPSEIKSNLRVVKE